MSFLAAFQPTGELVKVAQPALSTLAQTALGAIALVCLAVAVLAVWKLSCVQDRAADRAEVQGERIEKLITEMTKTFSSVDKTLAELIQAERGSQRVQQEQMNLLQQMKNSIDTTIRDAVLANTRYRRSATPPSGGVPRP